RGGLGYQGIGRSVAVKLSTFQHPGDPSDTSTGLAINGANPRRGLSPLPSGRLLNNQATIEIVLTYDVLPLPERIYHRLTGHFFSAPVGVDIRAIVGSDAAYVGFTGASGTNDFWELQDIASWRFTSQVPVPGAPTNLRVAAFTSSAIDLAWNSNSYNESGF